MDRNFGEGVAFVPEYLNEATTEQLLARLLRNLKNAYTQSYAYDWVYAFFRFLSNLV